MKKLSITENETNTNIENIRTRIVPDGYVCKIVKVEDVSQKEYLKIEFDVTEGEYEGYYADMASRLHFWAGTLIRSYKPSALGMFGAFISAVKKSNPGFIWNNETENDEHTLEGCEIGLVLGDEEYVGKDGTVKHRMRVAAVKTVDEIRAGAYKVPEPKTLQQKPAVAVAVVDTTTAPEMVQAVNAQSEAESDADKEPGPNDPEYYTI